MLGEEGPDTGTWQVKGCLGWDLEKEPSRLRRGVRKGLPGEGGRRQSCGQAGREELNDQARGN